MGTLSVYFLCAGYGRRLRPLTDRIPKPAIPFQGASALEINHRKTGALRPSRTLCNTHHLPDSIRAIARPWNVDILHEPEILGTGGCLWNAKTILTASDRFLVHNGDLIHSIDLAALVERHAASGDIATLAGVYRAGQTNSLCRDASGKLAGVHGYRGFDGAAFAERCTFSGIAVYDRGFLDFAEPGTEDIKYFWSRALEAGRSIGVADCSRDAWFDFGAPQGLWEAARFVMEQNGNYSYGYHGGTDGKPQVSNEAGLGDLPRGLRNVLLYEQPTASVPENARDCILGRDFRWEIDA